VEIFAPTGSVGFVCCDDPKLAISDADNNVENLSSYRCSEDKTAGIGEVIRIIFDDFSMLKGFFDFAISDASLLKAAHHMLRDFHGVIVAECVNFLNRHG